MMKEVVSMSVFAGIPENFRQSYQELKKVRTLTTLSLLVALGVVLGLFTIIPNEFLKIGLRFLITASMGFLFGPVPAMLGAAAIDLLVYILRPTGPYFFGFTFNAALTGLIYGLFLYRRPMKLWRAFLAKGVVNLAVNVMLSTVWLSMLYGKSVAVLFPARLIKNAVALPAEAILLWAVLSAVGKAWRRTRAVSR